MHGSMRRCLSAKKCSGSQGNESFEAVIFHGVSGTTDSERPATF